MGQAATAAGDFDQAERYYDAALRMNEAMHGKASAGSVHT